MRQFLERRSADVCSEPAGEATQRAPDHLSISRTHLPHILISVHRGEGGASRGSTHTHQAHLCSSDLTQQDSAQGTGQGGQQYICQYIEIHSTNMYWAHVTESLLP